MGRRHLDGADLGLTGSRAAGAWVAAAGGAALAVSEPFDWIGQRSAWDVFHGLDIALLLLALLASGVAVATLTGSDERLPVVPGHAVAACGAIATTVVLIFVDTAKAELGAFLGLAGALAMLAGGLLLEGRVPSPGALPPPPDAGAGVPPPGWYPDPRSEARLRYWDGREWTPRTGE